MESKTKTVSHETPGLEIALSKIEKSGFNPRQNVKGERFAEFKASIKEQGILEPLLVRPKGDKFELIAGERRFTAAKELGMKTVPAIVRAVDDHTAREIMLLENLQREDLSPLEEAFAISELLAGDGMKQEELAKKIGKSQPWIANRLRLNKAPPELKKFLEKGEISPQHVIVLLPYVEHELLRKEILEDLKQSLQDREDGYGEPITVESVKNRAYDVLEEQGMDLDLNDYNYQGLKKYFDFSECDACKTLIRIAGEDEKTKTRVCLNKLCFSGRLAAARQKLTDAQKDKLSKTDLVNTEKMSYRDYRDFEGCTFDRTLCKDCENHKMQKPRYAKFGKDKNELEEICLKPSCFQGKTAQATRRKNVACREELAFVEESIKGYLEKRPSSFTWTELRFIVHRVDTSRSPKKGATLKELEDQLLRHVMDEELRDYKHSLNLAHLKQVECEWPFKVTRKKAEQPAAPKAKKVEEKRSKKAS